MTNRELYNQIQNPLDNDETLQLFLECYQQIMAIFHIIT